jgi:RecB family exonuclease
VSSSATAWSVSREWLWDACPRQYSLRYLRGARPAQPVAPNRARGIVAHAGMEGAYRAAQEEGPRESGLMLDFAQESRLSMMDTQEWRELSTAERGDILTLVEDCLESLPTPHATSILGVECAVDMTLDGLDVTAILDVVLRTGRRSLHVRDYKTSALPRKPDELESNMQLAVCALAASQRWPWADTITVGLYSLPKRREIIHRLSRKSVATLVRHLVAQAERAHARESFPATPGDHCATCRFRSYCPEFAGVDFPLASGLSPVDVAREQFRLDNDFTPQN